MTQIEIDIDRLQEKARKEQDERFRRICKFVDEKMGIKHEDRYPQIQRSLDGFKAI